MLDPDVTTEARHGIPAGVKLTPMLKQYVAAKERYPDALLFFRMGDFYEMFFQDAEIGGRYLDLTVTSRDKKSSVPAPMSGFPHHQLSAYLAKALEAGLKVAICDQLEDPSLARGLVERGITRVVTPGIILDDEGLEARLNNFLVAIVPGAGGGKSVRAVAEPKAEQSEPAKRSASAAERRDNSSSSLTFSAAEAFAVAALDVSTGDFRVTEVVGASALRCELSRLEPREVVVPDDADGIIQAAGDRLRRVAVSRPGAQFFSKETAHLGLKRLIGPEGGPAIEALDAFGFGSPSAVLRAAGAVVAYVTDTQRGMPKNTRILHPYRVQDTLVLDETAKSNLELFRTLMEGRKKGSLLGTLDRAATAMGGRRLRQWLAFPLVAPSAINARLDAVGWLKDHPETRGAVRAALGHIYDLERLTARVAAGRAGPKDLYCLRVTLEQTPLIVENLREIEPLAAVAGRIDPVTEVSERLARALVDDPPAQLRDGGVIRAGFDAELDELVDIAENGKDWLLRLEAREREATGIGSLKVSFNRVFGYFIEVSRPNVHLVPTDRFIRKQTTSTGERYFTHELKDFEDKVLNAEGRRASLESELFNTLRAEVATHIDRIGATAGALAELDALTALAEVAHLGDWCRPTVDDSDVLDIEDGRHPVVEEAVGREAFVPNSLRLDRDEESLVILTGPNMAGKSTVMRQVAIITLLAQVGSFVPARHARIGVVDRIFTRVGAADDLAAGRSTFMVEMNETATILREATARSLLILDEIGRGTSTCDGVSIAWAVAEYIHDVLGARTLFATHYHELTDLAAVKPRVRNYTIAVKEWGEEVIFLRQLVAGGANRSYGIQVARLAGLPKAVIERAKVVLNNLEGAEHDEVGQPRLAQGGQKVVLPEQGLQLSLFSPPPIPAAPSVVERTLRAADLDHFTPMQALNFLHALREKLK